MLSKVWKETKEFAKYFLEYILGPFVLFLLFMGLVLGVILCIANLITRTPEINFIHEEKPKDQQPFFCAFFEKENELKCMPYEDFLEMLKERNKEDAIKL